MNAAKGHVAVPAFVIAISPLTTIILDDRDALGTTLEQANNNTYDRVRLCRTSMSLDVGLKWPALLTYTGAILLPRAPGITPETAVSHANQLLLDLLFGGVHFDAATLDEVSFGCVYDTGYFMAGGGAPGPNSALLQALQYGDTSSFDSVRLLGVRCYKCSDVTLAREKGRPVRKKLGELNASLMLDGLTAFRLNRRANAIVFIWSSIETLITKAWDDKVSPSNQAIRGRSAFVSSQSWQPAHKVEVLFQVGVIDAELYGHLNDARLARNKLAHRGEVPSLGACGSALEALLRLCSLVYSAYADQNLFLPLMSHFHAPHRGVRECKPDFWRHLPAIPGNEQWGDRDFPRYPELELVEIGADGARRKDESGGAPLVES